jgi:chromosomal replication initiation ATPase DnaA
MKRDLRYIESVVCAEENVEPELLHNPKRQGRYKEIRQIIMFISLFFGETLYEVGRYFNRDHATASNARTRIRNLCDTELCMKQKVERYIKIIKEGDLYKMDYIANRVAKLRAEVNELVTELEKIKI